MFLVNRRNFLSFAGTAFAAPQLLISRSAKPADRAAGSPAGSWQSAIIVNALGGLENPNLPDAETQPKAATVDERVLREGHASGLTAVNVTLGYVSGDMEPFEFTVRDVAEMDALIRANSKDLVKIHTAADILRAKYEGRIGIIYGFQNAAMLGSDAARVDVFANLGVRVIQLTYNPANQIGDGSAAPMNRGLTPLDMKSSIV